MTVAVTVTVTVTVTVFPLNQSTAGHIQCSEPSSDAFPATGTEAGNTLTLSHAHTHANFIPPTRNAATFGSIHRPTVVGGLCHSNYDVPPPTPGSTGPYLQFNR